MIDFRHSIVPRHGHYQQTGYSCGCAQASRQRFTLQDRAAPGRGLLIVNLISWRLGYLALYFPGIRRVVGRAGQRRHDKPRSPGKISMKSLQQKREEALARLQANMARCEAEIAEIKHRSKTWIKPGLRVNATQQDRLLFALLPKENPFFRMIDLKERHLKRLETEQQKLRNIISNNKKHYS